MLPHPSSLATACTNKSSTGLICVKPVDPHQHHCYGCKHGGTVDRQLAAVGRCLADVIQTHSGTKVPIELTIPCRQIHLTRHFSHAICTIHFMHITLHGSSVCMRASFHLQVIHDERLIVSSLSVFVFVLLFSPLFTSSLPHSTCTLIRTPSSMSTAPRETTAAPSPNEEYCPLATYHPPTFPASAELRTTKLNTRMDLVFDEHGTTTFIAVCSGRRRDRRNSRKGTR